MPTERMGPAARSFAADAHDCIMVRIQTDLPHTSVRRKDAPMASSPRMIMTQTPELRNEKPIALFIVPPRAQAFKALRNTSDAKAARRPAPLAFRSLDPFRALREPDRRRRDEERPFPVGSRTGAPVGRDIPTVPRFQPPPRRTQHADFPHCAPPFASRQGLWDLSYRGNFRSVVSHSIAVEQS